MTVPLCRIMLGNMFVVRRLFSTSRKKIKLIIRKLISQRHYRLLSAGNFARALCDIEDHAVKFVDRIGTITATKLVRTFIRQPCSADEILPVHSLTVSDF